MIYVFCISSAKITKRVPIKDKSESAISYIPRPHLHISWNRKAPIKWMPDRGLSAIVKALVVLSLWVFPLLLLLLSSYTQKKKLTKRKQKKVAKVKWEQQQQQRTNERTMSLESLTKQLTASFDAKDYKDCQLILPKIKLELVKNNLLIPVTSQKNKNLNDLIITRSILEIGAFSSINLSQYELFESYILQLKVFYSLPSLPVSKNKNKLVSLYLLLLLSQGLLDKFHIELEAFLNENKTIDDLEKDLNLKIPINLEKWIIDGDYFKIFEIFKLKKFPSDEFSIFETNLLNQIRQEIIKNFNKSYKKLPLKNLKILLFLNDYKNDQVLSLIESQPNWILKDDIVYFEELPEDDEDGQRNDANEIILKNCLFYAKEIETII